MNAKRIAAIIGLAAIFLSIVCIVVSGFVPALHELLLTLSGMCFLIAAATLGLLVLHKKEEQAAQNDEQAE